MTDDPHEKRKQARRLKHAAEDINDVADEVDEHRGFSPRAKHLRDQADEVEKTAEVMADEAETEDL